jgi:competence protein ComEC
VLALVLVQPVLARSWGFALSVAATAGLLLLLPAVRVRLARWPPMRRLPPVIVTALAVTITAQVSTAPLLLVMVGTVGWVAVPANLLAMPAVPIVTVLGLATAALGPLVPGIASMLGIVAAWPAGWIATVAQVGAALPGAQMSGLALALAAAGVVVLIVGRGSAILRPVVALSLVVSVLAVPFPPSRRGWPPPDWLVIMCDVGQGDAILVRAGPDSAVVVDAGPEPERIDRCLADAGVASIPAVLLTHFHVDHVGGLAGVLRGRQVATVLSTPVRDPVAEATSVDRVLADHGVRLETVTAGDRRTLPGLSWQVLWPRRRITSGSVPNNASLVLAVEVGGRSLLLAGDIEPEAQAAISVDLRQRAFDVVKVPHHGSRYQAPDFVSWARAPIALVSAGAGNDYGHPAPETLAAWARIGALVGRTDQHGDLAVVESGSGLGLVARGGMLPSS